ncbi:MAG: ABC transporter [Cyanobacteria bacterium PR.3.49]|nr:ABC transporter [Cyanobacteria bacterium PR.3.49]
MFSGAPPVHLMWSNMFDPKRPKIEKAIDWKRLGRLFLPYWKQEIVVVVCITAVALLGLLPPVLTMNLIDKAIPSGNFQSVVMLVGFMVAAAIGASLISAMQGYMNSLIGESIMRDLRLQLMTHMHRMPLDFFTSTKTGEVVNRVTNDVDSIDSVVSGTLVMILMNTSVIITTLVTIFLLDWRLSLISLAVLPFMVAPLWPVGRKMYNIRKATREKRDEMQSIGQETLSVSGILLLKSFNREGYERDRYHRLGSDLMKSEIKLAMVGRWFMALINAMVTLGPACIWLYGGWLCIHSGITVGMVVTFVALLSRLYTPVAALAGVQIQVMTALAVFERIFDYLDLEEEKNDSNMPRLAVTAGDISFEDVSFSYPNGRRAIEAVSFHIKPGQMAALVGPSGAGKTTISMLLPRFYLQQEGSIKIDGQDVRDVQLSSLRENIGIVTQETYLFHDTVFNNLIYARPDATRDQVITACKAANIHDFIETLENKYDTTVGERGHKLSGGERQRLAIARVLLKNPQILILDEATSSLDSENEALIQAALTPLIKGRTSLVIAHRLSTIVQADLILAVEDGRIVESGSHEELIQKDGLYNRLYKTQFRETAAV